MYFVLPKINLISLHKTTILLNEWPCLLYSGLTYKQYDVLEPFWHLKVHFWLYLFHPPIDSLENARLTSSDEEEFVQEQKKNPTASNRIILKSLHKGSPKKVGFEQETLPKKRNLTVQRSVMSRLGKETIKISPIFCLSGPSLELVQWVHLHLSISINRC